MTEYSREQLTTDSVATSHKTEYWIDMICNTFVRLGARDMTGNELHGSIKVERIKDVEFSTVRSGAQQVYRSRRQIAEQHQAYMLFSIQQRGEGWVEQDGRVARLRSGELAMYDSTRPYTLYFNGPFQQLVVQVPKIRLGVEDTRSLTAVKYLGGTPGGVVAELLTSMNRHLSVGGSELSPLVEHVLTTVRAAIELNARPDCDIPGSGLKQQALAIMKLRMHKAGWGVADLARECHVSERTLHRAFGEESVGSVLRRIRVEEASELLLGAARLSVQQVAAQCGYGSESGFIRAFRAELGVTPREYTNFSN